MQPIVPEQVQQYLTRFVETTVYLHLETTNGAYTEGSLGASISGARGAFVRNAPIRFQRAAIKGNGPYRVGLKLDHGWVYAEGLTDWTLDGERLLLAGMDQEGRLAVALELSPTPFSMWEEN